MNWDWQHLAFLVGVGAYFGIVPVVINEGLNRLFRLSADEIRSSRTGCLVLAVAFGVPVWLAAMTEFWNPIIWLLGFGFTTPFAVLTAYSMYGPGADIQSDGIVIRRWSGRRIKLEWPDIECAKLTVLGQYFTIFAKSGGRFGLRTNSLHLGYLYYELRAQGIAVPQIAKFENALRNAMD